jgi:Protein of unknown function (DUF3343).
MKEDPAAPALSQEIVLTFPNVQNALRGEQALLDSGLAVRIMSRPAALGEGCGICLRINVDEYDAVRESLQDAAVLLEAAHLKEQGKNGTAYTQL